VEGEAPVLLLVAAAGGPRAEAEVAPGPPSVTHQE
jgi:hypothetical protein